MSEEPVSHSASLQFDSEMDQWHEQVLFFEAHHHHFLQDQKLTGKYIAIKDKTIIDRDVSDLVLVRRVQAHFPDKVVLVVKIENRSPIMEIPAPELA